jgi:hypothetical protein
MKKLLVTVCASAALLVSLPAQAVQVLTFNLGTGVPAAQTVGSRTVVNGGVTLTATARLFQAAPDSLTLLSDTLGLGSIRVTSPGIGVVGGSSGEQIDTNRTLSSLPPGAREAVLLSASTAFSLREIQLSFVDNNDTLQVYGVQGNGSLVNLGYPGLIRSGLAGGLLNGAATGPAFAGTLNGGTQSLSLVSPTAFFDRYLFTTRVGGATGAAQGYRLDSLVIGVNPIPEPESWALLIVGFGLIGVTARRRRTAVSA